MIDFVVVWLLLQVSIEDTASVIVQSLFEASATCYLTNYDLAFRGKLVDIHTPLSTLQPPIQANDSFIMIKCKSSSFITSSPPPSSSSSPPSLLSSLSLYLNIFLAGYTVESAKYHTRCVREILWPPCTQMDLPNICLLPNFTHMAFTRYMLRVFYSVVILSSSLLLLWWM